MHLFWEQGYERTTLRDLTDVMGISAPSLYNAFGDKKALFDEAVAEYARSSQVIVADTDEPISRMSWPGFSIRPSASTPAPSTPTGVL